MKTECCTFVHIKIHMCAYGFSCAPFLSFTLSLSSMKPDSYVLISSIYLFTFWIWFIWFISFWVTNVFRLSFILFSIAFAKKRKKNEKIPRIFFHSVLKNDLIWFNSIFDWNCVNFFGWVYFNIIRIELNSYIEQKSIETPFSTWSTYTILFY